MSYRILYILPYMNLGGTEVHTVELIKGIRDEYDVLVAGPDGPGISLLEENDISYTSLPGLTPYNIRVYKDILSRIIRDYKPDLIHIQGRYEPVLFSKKISPSTPVILTCHGYGNAVSPFDYMFTAITGNRWGDRVITVCNYDKELLLKFGLNPEKVSLIYNGISSIDERKPLPYSISLKIGTIASLIKRKGISYLIEAMSLITKRFNDVGLFIIGEGKERISLESLVNQLNIKNHVYFLGGLPKARCYICNFDIFVLPSLFESLPVSIIEAYAEGRPVIASRVGGVPELVIDEVTGILVPPKDSQILAKAIERLIEDRDLRERLAKNGYNRYLEDFTFSAMVEKTRIVYRDVLK